PPLQISLRCSNGSAHSRQRYSALHAVPLKRESCSAAVLPHRGHRTVADGGLSTSGTGPAAGRGAGPGGAIPASASLRLPSELIQSLLHGGCRTTRTSTSGYPAVVSARTRSSRMVSMAGQPV